MSLRPILARLAAGERLAETEAETAFGAIMEGEATPAQIAGLLMAMRVRGETVAEITGAVRALRNSKRSASPTASRRKVPADKSGARPDRQWLVPYRFLLPYLLVFPAFLKLRRTDAATPRPYRVPGNRLAIVAMASICFLFAFQAIIFFVWVPGEPIDWATAGPIVGGVVLTIVLGEVILLLQGRHKKA